MKMYRAALLVLVVSVVAVADETLHLVFTNGERRRVTVSSFDAAGLVVGQEKRKIAWQQLAPESAFRARKTLTAAGDGNAVLALAEFATRLKLFPEALEQLEMALALGGLDETTFEKRAGEIARQESEYLCARIDALLASGEQPGVCLKTLRSLKKRYPDHPNNAKYQTHLERLALAIAQRDKQGQPGKGGAELDRLRKGVAKTNAKKEAALEKADKLRQEAESAIAKHQLSRIKKKLLKPSGAEKYYKDARKHLRSIASLDKESLVTSKATLRREYGQIEKKLVDCYLVVARALIRERNYKGTVKYVRRILLLDPIHEEAWEMVKEMEKNRIHFKSSDIGGGRPKSD